MSRRYVSSRHLFFRPVLEQLESRTLLTGTWTTVANLAPSAPGTMMLLSDGTVMVQGASSSAPFAKKTWYELTPDSSGSYVNGAWSQRASMGLERLYYGSNVLPDGRVFVVGGEYSGPSGSQNWTNTGEIYNPVSNTWTNIANFPQSQFGDDPTMVLPDGRVLAGYLSGPQTYIYNPTANTWTATGTKLHSDKSDEEAWVKLPDDSILSYDVWGSSATVGHAQRYVPSTGTWVDAGTPPAYLTGSGFGFELGPALLLPDGRVFQIGANNHTAFYTPSTNTWAAGPDIPNSGTGQLQGADDAPAAILPNGKILMAVDHPLFNGPTNIYEFDPITNTYANVTPASSVINLSGASYIDRMLVLPTGQVLLGNWSGNRLAVYTPDGSASSAWKPAISSVVDNGDGTFTLTGTQLNGISEGASYGDDAEMSSNYPIIRLLDGSGNVTYCRTFNWSNTGVATGSTVETVRFTVPAGVSIFNNTVSVVANGIGSDPLFLGLRVTSATPAPSVVGSISAIRVTFNEAIQPSSFSTDQVSLQSPSGIAIPVTITAVAGSGNQQFDLSFASQTALGIYPLTVGPNITDLAGRMMDQDGDGVGGSTPDDQFTTTVAVQGLQVTSSAAFADHVRLTFNEPIDPTTLTPIQIVAFTGPAGAIDLTDATMTAVAGGPNQADVNFDSQTVVGNYDLTVGPAIRDLFGHQMDQNNNFIDGEVPGDQYDATWTILQPAILTDTGVTHGGSYLPGALSTVVEQVTFNGPMDPTTFTPDKVALNGPGGIAYPADSVTPVPGSNNTSFNIGFTANTTGSYTMVIGPNILDSFGNAMASYPAIPFNVLGPRVLASTPSGGTQGPVDHIRVTFNEAMDLTTFTTGSVVTFTGPSGAITPTGVSSVGGTNTVFDISFDPQTAPGNYTMVLSETIQDAFGNQMDQNINLITGENPDDRYTAQFSITFLQNGGFETGNFSGWTQSGDLGATAVSGTFAGTAPHSGNFQAYFGPTGGLGFITQNLPTTVGVSYTLSFWLAHPYTSTGTEWLVRVGGNTLTDVHNDGNFGYTQFMNTFTATSNTTALQFGFLEPPSYFFLDDVTVTVSTPGPGGLPPRPVSPPGGGPVAASLLIQPTRAGSPGSPQDAFIIPWDGELHAAHAKKWFLDPDWFA